MDSDIIPLLTMEVSCRAKIIVGRSLSPQGVSVYFSPSLD